AVGLTVFVKMYLTDERLSALIVPHAEKALGRQVELGKINVSLLKGITVNDFTVKEADGNTDFVRIKGFILRYELMPILQKKLVVSEIQLVEPQIILSRDKTGNFNFSSLPMLEKAVKADEKKKAPTTSQAVAIPIALTMDTIKVSKARVTVTDARGEIPDVDTLADLVVSVNMGHDLASLRYNGTLTFSSDAKYQGVQPHVTGKIDFDNNQVSYGIDVKLDKEAIRLAGAVQGYMKTPDIELNVSSKSLNIDHLMALTAGLGETAKHAGVSKQTSTTKKKTDKKSAKSIGSQLPAGLKVHGQVQIAEAMYKNLPVRDFQLDYLLENNIFTVSRFITKTAGGEIHKNIELDLNQVELAYKGQLEVKAIQMDQLQAGLFPQIPERLSGALSTNLAFAGAGLQWPSLRDKLNMTGDYTLSNGQLQNVNIAKTIAEVVGLSQLKDIQFKDLSGNMEIHDGKMLLKYKMDGRDVSLASEEGVVSLDGTAVDMPFHLTFSPEISEKLKQRSALANYLTDDTGQTSMHLKVTGSVRKPRVTLDSSGVQKQVTDTLKKKAFEELDRTLESGEQDTDKSDPVAIGRELLKGFFGQ
ncbi:MAG: AsmA family protein, partial [Deltaproteobacteria bacterium]|nr:AsmA family protein [Deltaproteobacteria bacterium]